MRIYLIWNNCAYMEDGVRGLSFNHRQALEMADGNPLRVRVWDCDYEEFVDFVESDRLGDLKRVNSAWVLRPESEQVSEVTNAKN